MQRYIAYSFLKNFLTKPIYLIIFVTGKCNARCGHCFLSNELNSPNEDLSLQEITSFSKKVGNLVEVDISGGEPFLRKDLFDIYKTFVDNNHMETFAVPTNGILTDTIASSVAKMLSYGFVRHFTLVLSLDGPEHIHNRMRGVSCYKNLISTYHELAGLKKRYPQLHLRVNSVITSSNYEQLECLHEEVKSIMPELDYHDMEIVRGIPRDSLYAPPSIAQLQELRPAVSKIWKYYAHKQAFPESRVSYNMRMILYDAYLKILTSNYQPWPCWAGRVHCVLGYRGDVSFCELLPKIGNVRENDFESIWTSPAAEHMRTDIKNRKCSCINSCFQSTNVLFNHHLWPGMVL
jgi:MoaA/NifB/PqqE/SkfB family radical SAM enzyme